MFRKTVFSLLVISLLFAAFLPDISKSLHAKEEINITDSADTEWGGALSAGTDGNFHMIYRQNSDSDDEMYYRRLSLDGETVGVPKLLASAPSDTGFRWSEVAADHSGGARVVFSSTQIDDNAANIYYTGMSSAGSTPMVPKKVHSSDSDSLLCDLDVDSDGNVYVVWLETGSSPQIKWLKLSTTGATLIGPLNVSEGLGFNGDISRPRIAVKQNGTSYVVYERKDNALARWEIMFTSINPDGNTIVSPRNCVRDLVYDINQIHVDLDGNYELHLSYIVNDGAFYSKVNRNGYAEIDKLAVSDPRGGSALAPDVACDDHGNVYCAYMERSSPANSWNICVKDKKKNEASFGDAVRLDPSNVSSMYPRLSAVEDGAGVVYQRNDDMFWSTVVTEAPNLPPVAVLEIDPVDTEVGSTVRFMGNASSDPDGSVAEYYFDYGDGVTSGWTGSSVEEHVYDSEGTYTAVLIVRDDQMEESPEVSADVVVAEGNQIPVAVIESIIPNPVVFGHEVRFKGKGTDGDGTVEEYRWSSDLDGDLSSDRIFSSSTLIVGKHSIGFSVKDDGGAWSEEVKMELVVTENRVFSLTDNTGVEKVKTGESVEFRVTYSDPDGDAPVSGKLFYQVDGGMAQSVDLLNGLRGSEAFSDGHEFSVTMEFDEAGLYTYWFEFENEQNGVVTTDKKAFEVEEDSETPGFTLGIVLVSLVAVFIVMIVTGKRI